MPRAQLPRPKQSRLLRLRGQRLLPSRLAPTIPAAAHAIAGFQAQSWPDALLSVRSRTRGLTAADVERARVEDRTVVRSWFMRGTLHLVATEDVGWLLGLLGPGQIAAGRRRREDLGLDEATYASAVSVLEAELAEGPKTRAEIDDALVRHGVRLKPKTQAAIHLIQRAALEGRVCYGADRGRQKELVLLRDWVDVGPALDPDVALVELARRYLASDPCADGIDVVYISYTHRRRPVKVKLRKVGNSYTVTVPKEIVDSLSLEEGGELEIDLIAREDRVVLKPARSRLDRVMARMRAKARARGVTEADADAAVREIRGRR